MAQNCLKCGCELSASTTVLQEDWTGVRIVVEEYPVLVCARCPETYYSGRTYRVAVAQVIKALARAAGVPVDRYAVVDTSRDHRRDLSVLAALEKLSGQSVTIRYVAPRVPGGS